MRWYEFKCKNCNRVLNSKKFEVYTESREIFCIECSKTECIGCGVGMFENPKNIAKCKKCKIKENKELRKVFPSTNGVYLLYSKKLNIFKIGESNSVVTRLSKIKYEAYPSVDWSIIDFFPYTEKKLLERVLHSRFQNFKIDDNKTDYFENIHFMLEPKYFIKECRFCVDFLKPYRKN